MDEQSCILCGKSIGGAQHSVKLTAKGCAGINKASELRGNSLIAKSGQHIHEDCRRLHTNPNVIAKDVKISRNIIASTSSKCTLRSSESKFCFATDCLFCGQPDLYNAKKKEWITIPVTTSGFQVSVSDICKRRNDMWAVKVQSRIEYSQDLFASDAVYHQSCSVNFRTFREIPEYIMKTILEPEFEQPSKKRRKGRPVEYDREIAFEQVIQHLKENDEEQITISDLTDMMNNYLRFSDHDAFTVPYMKQKLAEHFKEELVIASFQGKEDVVTLKRAASSILYDFYSEPRSTEPESDKQKVVLAAAQLLRSDIKSLNTFRDIYPSSHTMTIAEGKKFLPDTLRVFLEAMIIGKNADIKIASIGQAIMQAVRPHVLLAPLQVGLGVQMHRKFGSEFLINSLYRHGFSISYSEVKKFEANAAASSRTDINFQAGEFGQCLQFIADNIDHNLCTIDGLHTFHGMGIIATVTPSNKSIQVVPRNSIVSEDIKIAAKIKIHFFNPQRTIQDLKYEKLVNIIRHAISPSSSKATPVQENSESCIIADTLKDTKGEIFEVCSFFKKLMSHEISIQEMCAYLPLKNVYDRLNITKNVLEERSRTAKLWLQYMNMVDLLKKYLKAERTGNWLMHLQCIHDMIPIFAASGHNNYAKCSWLYYQKMTQLQEEHLEVYNHFIQGHHVIRRSDRFWAGLSPDLVIEQVLMRSLKSNGGLTRGRGMSELQRALWILSMPACTEVQNAMEDFTKLSYVTSEQHKDLTNARRNKDEKDTENILAFLKDRNPFSGDSSLRNIVTGVVADKTVNVETAASVGLEIMECMTGQSAIHYSFKRKQQAITLATKHNMKIDGDEVKVDIQLLFQRLTLLGDRLGEDMRSLLSYELCNRPSAFFDTNGLLREANKPALANAIWSKLGDSETLIAGDTLFVLDGGSLLQHIPWSSNTTFDNICESYLHFVEKHYKNATIVFDGYTQVSSTKDIAHLRRNKGFVGPVVHFTSSTINTTKKEQFLSNHSNKQAFINLLGEKLLSKGYIVKHASGDADRLIVTVALESAAEKPTIVVGDDTDLLVLLLFYTTQHSCDIYLKPHSAKFSLKQSRIWNIKQIQMALGRKVCDNIMFAHAILGCDTTSHIFGLGKGIALNKIIKKQEFAKQAEVFVKPIQNSEDIIEAGEKAIVSLYDGEEGESLDELRYKMFCHKTSTAKTSIQPETLPPTSAAAKYHSLRVYCQIQEWLGHTIDPQEWGWKVIDSKLFPLYTDKPPAPPSLLKLIRCNCKKGCGRACSCRKQQFRCSVSCGHCHGTDCSNCEIPDDYDEI